MHEFAAPLTVAQIARWLKFRKQANGQTVLFLGARTGGLYRSLALYALLKAMSSGDLATMTQPERFQEYYRILRASNANDKHTIVKFALKDLVLSETDIYVAKLLQMHLFNLIITTNIDMELERALAHIGMQGLRDFTLFIPKKTIDQSTPFSYEKNSCLLVKACGDFASGEYSIPALAMPTGLKRIMDDIRNQNILIVGFDPYWDAPLAYPLFTRTGLGTTWYVNEEHSATDISLFWQLKNSNAECIFGTNGSYERFFKDLFTCITAETLQTNATVAQKPISAPEHLLFYDTQPQSRQNSTPQLEALQVSIDIPYTYIPGGLLQFYQADTMPLVIYTLQNTTAKPLRVFLTSEIKGFSYNWDDTRVLSPQEKIVVHHLPVIKQDAYQTLNNIKNTTIHISVSYIENESTHPHLEHDYNIHLMPRNMIRWAMPDKVKGTDYISLLEHLAAWVTPRTEMVQHMLYRARDYHPEKMLQGYLSIPDPAIPRTQVKAIYQALQAADLAYINSPFVIGPKEHNEFMQTVRLPDESLQYKSANCIDASVLFASLIEQASLEPVIIIQTEHAFIGWKIWPGADTYEFLETTMLSHTSFEEALEAGNTQYRHILKNAWFQREVFAPAGFARLLDICKLHAKYHPMEP